jgi:large subunit ribosomal protein L24
MKFRIGDEVLVTSGKDKGKHGKIERVFPGVDQVMVGGVNLFKKHVKNTSDRTKTGGIIDIGKPLATAKIAFVCKKCTQQTRIGIKLVGDKKVRFCKKCGQEI